MTTQANTKLWELAGKEEGRVFSPYAWRVRLVLAHKGLKFETVPWRYSEKDLIKPSDKVPVLDIEDKRLFESWEISKYLDEQRPDQSLFKTKCQAGASGIQFITTWADNNMYMAITVVILMDMYNHLAPQDKDYFRKSREALFGQKLEEVCKDSPAKIAAFRKEMEPLRQTLKDHKWLGGEQIDYADIAVAGMFLWARAISDKQLLEKDDPIFKWRERIFKVFNSTIKNSIGYPV
ncbi:hypothetical protein WJX74_003460 [Apatococcus lobatus]|uniref:Glutathione S-transferase n=1 Tax=Apatococcus lobatus TaxID=904363 RepID=A0AAW1QYM1_9CHLO